MHLLALRALLFTNMAFKVPVTHNPPKRAPKPIRIALSLFIGRQGQESFGLQVKAEMQKQKTVVFYKIL
jgi:hypothetical protein